MVIFSPQGVYVHQAEQLENLKRERERERERESLQAVIGLINYAHPEGGSAGSKCIALIPTGGPWFRHLQTQPYLKVCRFSHPVQLSCEHILPCFLNIYELQVL